MQKLELLKEAAPSAFLSSSAYVPRDPWIGAIRDFVASDIFGEFAKISLPLKQALHRVLLAVEGTRSPFSGIFVHEADVFNSVDVLIISFQEQIEEALEHNAREA